MGRAEKRPPIVSPRVMGKRANSDRNTRWADPPASCTCTGHWLNAYTYGHTCPNCYAACALTLAFSDSRRPHPDTDAGKKAVYRSFYQLPYRATENFGEQFMAVYFTRYRMRTKLSETIVTST